VFRPTLLTVFLYQPLRNAYFYADFSSSVIFKRNHAYTYIYCP